MQDHSAERWLPIAGHDGYEVSDHGRVRSVDRTIYYKDGRSRWFPGTIIKPGRRKDGYLAAGLGHSAKCLIHSLVLEAFVGPRPDGGVACHWDDDRTNNRLSNLRWGTASSNMYDRVRNGIHHLAAKTNCKRGHRLSDPNLKATPGPGHRACLACHRAQCVVWRARVKKGVELDIQGISDAYYKEIMSGRAAPPKPRRSRRAA